MEPISRKHHYLPEFYLKGFTGTDGKFAVFDLETKRLKTKRLTPSQIFFEYDRNTFEIDGIKNDFVEKMYGLLEARISRVFKKLKEQKSSSILDVQDMFNIILFMGSIYWRIPKTDSLIKDVIADSTPNELNFKITNRVTGEEAPQSFYNSIKSRDEFVGAYRTVKPIFDYINGFDIRRIEHWVVFFAALNDKEEQKEMHLIGDNPIIFRQHDNTNIFDQELIMPLSSGKTLYHTRGKDIKIIEPTARIDVDKIIFLQSEKYVCGPDEAYLEKIAEQAYTYRATSQHASDFLRHRVFNIFYE